MPWPVPARKRNNYHPSDAKLYNSPAQLRISGSISVHIYQNKLELV